MNFYLFIKNNESFFLIREWQSKFGWTLATYSETQQGLVYKKDEIKFIFIIIYLAFFFLQRWLCFIWIYLWHEKLCCSIFTVMEIQLQILDATNKIKNSLPINCPVSRMASEIWPKIETAWAVPKLISITIFWPSAVPNQN